MASGAGSHPTRISPRKFSEKIALLNKKEREANAKFEEIIKEVHATKGKPHQQEPLASGNSNLVLYPDNDLSSLTDAELQFQLTNSTNYKAAHADSLEEIEKVYENLIKSVGQYEDNENQNQYGQSSGSCQQQHPQSTNDRSMVLDYSEEDASKPAFRSLSAGIVRQPQPDNSTSTYYHQETANIDYQANTNVRTNQRGQETTYNPYEPPSSPFINTFPEHNIIDVCVSASQHQQIHHHPLQHINCSGNVTSHQSDSVGRARVVSFGSASRRKFACVNAYPFNYPIDVSQQKLNHVHQKTTYHSTNAQSHLQHKNQYLKEPSDERSRQKSCSDPQLHITPGEQQTALRVHVPMDSCKLNNRLIMTTGQAVPINTTTNLMAMSGQDCRLKDQRSHHTTNSRTINIYDNCNHDGKIEYLNTRVQNNENQHRTITTIKSDCCFEQSQIPGDHQFGVCDTTTDSISRGPLPGIKICGIDDETNHSARMLLAMDQTPDNNTSNPSSRDGSLPDISNLKFGSPERGPVYQGQQWPSPDDSGQVVMDGNWSTYAMENVDMDLQIDTSQDAIEYNQTQQLTSTHRAQTLSTACRRDGGTFVQPINRVNNGLSSSDCGFNTSAFHHQQGKLMICASSDLYNNIMRSRSHNNISSMNGRKRSNNYPPDSLQNFEQRHHTSQYCLQTNHQPQVNVRRIAELKSHGTSTSPLDSSSNLNSPQSEMNSPGSSTTEQCEPALMFASINQQQQQREYHPVVPIACASSSTLVPDGMHLHTQHYKRTDVVSGNLDTTHYLQQQTPLTVTGTMLVDQPDCGQLELAESSVSKLND